MFDIRKRVFFPLSKSIKIVIKPSPYYSLASTGTVLETIINIILNVQNGRRTINVSDVKPYRQNELVECFSGKSIIIPVILIKPFYWLTYFLPRKYGYSLRCFY